MNTLTLKPNEKKSESKIPIRKITIARAEGPIHYCQTKEFESIKEANHWIDNQSYTYPRMGYDKHDVKIEYEDGFEYQFRLDCHHPENKYYSYSSNSIDGHLKQVIGYYTDPERNKTEECLDFYADFQERYEIG